MCLVSSPALAFGGLTRLSSYSLESVSLVLARYRSWRPESAVIGAGCLLIIEFGNFFDNYRSGERYVVEPGLYLLVISGLLFVLVGAGTVLKRHMTTRTDESREHKSVSSQADSER